MAKTTDLDDALFEDWLDGKLDSKAALATYMSRHRDQDEPDMIARLDNWQLQQRQMAVDAADGKGNLRLPVTCEACNGAGIVMVRVSRTADAQLAADVAEWGEVPRW